MIKLSLQSNIDERTEMAIEMFHELHSSDIKFHLYHVPKGTVHIDQLIDEAVKLGYSYVDNENYVKFTYKDEKPWAPHLEIDENLTFW